MVDTAFDVEPGFLGYQQNTAAAGAVRPAEIIGRCSVAGGLDHHRRFSSTLPPHTPMIAILRAICGAAATAS
jgi:hypothetical protein